MAVSSALIQIDLDDLIPPYPKQQLSLENGWVTILNMDCSSLEICSDLLIPRNNLSQQNILSSQMNLTEAEIRELWQTPLIKNPTFNMFNKQCIMHRQMGFFSDLSRGYEFSNQVMMALPLTELHKKLLQIVEQKTGGHFNGLLFFIIRA